MRFLKMSTYLNIKFATETNLADGELVRGMENQGGDSEVTKKNSNISSIQ